MHTRCLIASLILTVLVTLSGCSRAAKEVSLRHARPPVVAIDFRKEIEDGTWEMLPANGVVVGNRLLTCAHVMAFLEKSDYAPYINGRPVEVQPIGLTLRLDDFRDKSALSFQLMAQDSAIALLPTPYPYLNPIGIGDPAQLSVGDTLYVVVYDFDRPPERNLRAFEVRVDELTANNKGIPANVFGVTDAFGDLHKGISGSFVGRFNESTQRWDLYGILAGRWKYRGQRTGVVVRPTDQQLHWLIGEPDA